MNKNIVRQYAIQDREAGNVIDTYATIEEATTALAEYEATDKVDGTWTEGFYEIVYEYNQSTNRP